MNQERVKLIIQNLESLIECLKAELVVDEHQQSPAPSASYEEIAPYIEDYDEIYDENENY